MKDENGRCSEKKRLLRTIYPYCQLPKSLRKSAGSVRWSTTAQRLPRHSLAEKHPAARQGLYRIIRQRLFNPLFVPPSQKQAEKVGLRALSGRPQL
jgi:hypothetical protein